jgi:thiamine biosynthesis lipoprotein
MWVMIEVMKRLVICFLFLGLGCNQRFTQIEREGRVFGSYVRIKVIGEDGERLNRGVDIVLQGFHRFDSLWSAYSEKSEVSQLNRNLRLKVCPETRVLIERAKGFGKETNGVFDITVGPLMRLWGFRGGSFQVPAESVIRRVRQKVGYERVRVQGDSVVIDPGMEVDLGGIAVGYAIDWAVEVLESFGARSGLVDAGGDIRVFGPREWRVGIQSPRGESLVGVLVLKNQAVSTSGDYRRFFESGGKRFSHIIDPRTGYPAERCAAVTVIARNGVEADVFSTALFVMGVEESQKFLKRRSGVRAIFYQVKGDSIVRVEVGEN